MTDAWKDYGKALSLSNLLYLRVWSELTTYTAADAHFMNPLPTPVNYYALMSNVLALSVVLWCGITWARREPTGRALRLAKWAFLLVLVVQLNAIREVASRWFPYLRGPLFKLVGTGGVVALACVAVLAAVVMVVRWPDRIIAGAVFVVVILEPFVAMTFFRAGRFIWQYDGGPYQDLPTKAFQGPEGAGGNRRVVWVIFDELDQRLSFTERPASVELPEFDRLRAEALYATNAYSPSGSTASSLPSLITGRLVVKYEPDGPHDARLTLRGKTEAASWRTLPSAFSRARALGFHTGLVGWYLPYCRILSGDLNTCWWTPLIAQYNSMGSTFGEIFRHQPRSLVETSLFSPFGQSLSTVARIAAYRSLFGAALPVATDRRLGLTLVHFQPPHGPHTYNRFQKQFTLSNSPVAGYLDSMALADRTLGELRAALENVGLWDATTVLVSSDHWFRSSMALDGKLDRRIPFLLKLAGQRQGQEYGKAFNTIGSGDLLLAVLRGDIADATGAAHWLDAHPSYRSDPYIMNEN